VEELRLGDNDRLSAEVAILSRADLLVILTSVDGLLDSQGNKIPEVKDLGPVFHLASAEAGPHSSGGMVTKLQAVKMATGAGIPTVIASGKQPGILSAAISGGPVGTRFPV
jgi:glutamate 5-kinase